MFRAVQEDEMKNVILSESEFVDGRSKTSQDRFVFPRPLWERARVRGQINSENTFSKELSCNNSNYIEINKKLDCFGSKEPHNDDTNSVILSDSERSHQREDFANFAILRCTQNDETEPVIVSERETIQPIVNQKQLQGKIDCFLESSCPPLAGGPKSMISRRGKINCHVEEKGNLSLNNFVEDIPLTCTPKVRFSSLRTASSPARGEEFLDAHWKNSRKIAFTLAEVLITLGIIGVVAAITLPTVVNKYQSYVLNQQFRKAYSTLYNAIKLVQQDEPVACWYWDKRPYETIECTARNEYGTCIKWAMPNNQPTPSDYNGHFDDCLKFYENLRTTMKAVKYCPNNALKNGCITDNYKGMDKVNLEKNPDVAQDPEQSFSDSKMKNRYPAFITSDGVVYMYWDQLMPFFMFDINGHKGPNKWGYDIFDFSLRGNPNDGITKIGATYGYTEKGGKNINTMIQEF